MTRTRPIIALTTDFGLDSHYVAQIKGVLLSKLPELQIVDVTHSIPPQSLRHAEMVMRSMAFAMPLGTVHLVVVDPGVGTPRRGLAVSAAGMKFVGPDNGILATAFTCQGARTVTLDRPELFAEHVSNTFHGRDIFAPIAAELAAGCSLNDLGSAIHDPVGGHLPIAYIGETTIRGEVLIADSFGNLLTNIPASRVPLDWQVHVDGRKISRVATYGLGPPGVLLALEGSDGYLEIAVREGSAAETLGGGEGAELVCTRQAR